MEKLNKDPASPSMPADWMSGIVESKEYGHVILSPANQPVRRRILFVNSYGGGAIWGRIKEGLVPPHHLWGCVDLVRLGYQVALAEPLKHFYFRRHALPHDLALLKMMRNWLGKDGILYCGHTLLYWVPLLKSLGFLNHRIASVTYAREELDFCGTHTGIIALTPAAADQARKMAPKVKVSHASWGVDLNFFPLLPYDPKWFMSCGITERDHATLCAGSALTQAPIRIICPGLPKNLKWPQNVQVVDGVQLINGAPGWAGENKKLSFRDLLLDQYEHCAASLTIVRYDPIEKIACGFTAILEAMAMARPLIVTRTGAMPGELDVEKAGCGLHVPPKDPAAIAAAIDQLAKEPELARKMGERGRELCAGHYSGAQHARRLHEFFETF